MQTQKRDEQKQPTAKLSSVEKRQLENFIEFEGEDQVKPHQLQAEAGIYALRRFDESWGITETLKTIPSFMVMFSVLMEDKLATDEQRSKLASYILIMAQLHHYLFTVMELNLLNEEL